MLIINSSRDGVIPNPDVVRIDGNSIVARKESYEYLMGSYRDGDFVYYVFNKYLSNLLNNFVFEFTFPTDEEVAKEKEIVKELVKKPNE